MCAAYSLCLLVLTNSFILDTLDISLWSRKKLYKRMELFDKRCMGVGEEATFAFYYFLPILILSANICLRKNNAHTSVNEYKNQIIF